MSATESATYGSAKSLVLSEIGSALDAVDEGEVEELVEMLCSAERVFVIGVGRVLLVLQAFVKRLNHIGIRATYVGAIDEPAITQRDVLIVGSGSGETAIPVAIASIAKAHGARIVHIGSNGESSVGRVADLLVRIPCRTKLHLSDEIDSQQPMSSLFEQSLLLLEDIVSYMIGKRRDLDLKTLWSSHANLE